MKIFKFILQTIILKFFKTHKFTSKINKKHTNSPHKFKYHYTKIESCILTHDHQPESLNNV